MDSTSPWEGCQKLDASLLTLLHDTFFFVVFFSVFLSQYALVCIHYGDSLSQGLQTPLNDYHSQAGE